MSATDKGNPKRMYGLVAFVFVVSGVVMLVNDAPALIAGASVFIGCLFGWFAIRRQH